MPIIGKLIYRERPACIQSHQPYTVCCRARPGQTGSLIQEWGGGAKFGAGPVPSPTLSLSWALGDSFYLKVMVPKSSNITFWEQQNGHCYASRLKFPIHLASV
jgi:hypothetical protein